MSGRCWGFSRELKGPWRGSATYRDEREAEAGGERQHHGRVRQGSKGTRSAGRAQPKQNHLLRFVLGRFGAQLMVGKAGGTFRVGWRSSPKLGNIDGLRSIFTSSLR